MSGEHGSDQGKRGFLKRATEMGATAIEAKRERDAQRTAASQQAQEARVAALTEADEREIANLLARGQVFQYRVEQRVNTTQALAMALDQAAGRGWQLKTILTGPQLTLVLERDLRDYVNVRHGEGAFPDA